MDYFILKYFLYSQQYQILCNKHLMLDNIVNDPYNIKYNRCACRPIYIQPFKNTQYNPCQLLCKLNSSSSSNMMQFLCIYAMQALFMYM